MELGEGGDSELSQSKNPQTGDRLGGGDFFFFFRVECKEQSLAAGDLVDLQGVCTQQI